MKRAIGYVRVSTSEQGESGLGLHAQRETIENEAARRGWQLEIIEDRGASAKSMRRDGVREALRRLESGEAEVLIVAKLDRLTRSLADFSRLMEQQTRERWDLVACDLGIDTSTATGELIANLVMSVAQWERRAIGDRTRESLAAAKARGTRLGAPPAIPAAVRCDILKMRAQGLSLLRIAKRLNELKVPTAREGSRWHDSTVRGVLLAAERDAA